MGEEGVAISQVVAQELSAVATNLHELAKAQTATSTELKGLKERLLDNVDALSLRVLELEKNNAVLKSEVAALKSRQAPLTAPAAWVAVIISAVVAARQFFGM